jgi:hypothetical protein
MNYLSKNLSKLAALLLLLTLAACTNDPEPERNTMLVVTSDVADSTINPTLPVTFDLLVREGGTAVQGATVIVTRPNGVSDTLLTKTNANGTLRFIDKPFSGTYNQWVTYAFRAMKEGSKTSTRYVRHLKVAPPLTVRVADTTIVPSGQNARVSLTVFRDGTIPLPFAVVRVINEPGDMVINQPTNAAGEVIFEMPTDGVFTGVRHFRAIASMEGFASSDTVHFYINVTKVTLDPEVQLYFNSLGRNKVGVQWDPDPDIQLLTVNMYSSASDDTPIHSQTVTSGNRVIIENSQLDGVKWFGVSVNGNPEKPERYSWAPAILMPVETSGEQTVRLWESEAPQHYGGAGLIITPNGLQTIPHTSGQTSLIDLVLAEYPDGGDELPVALVSPGTDLSGIIDGKRTMFAAFYWDIVGGLQEDYYQTSLEGMIPTGEDAFNTMVIAKRGAPDPSSYSVLPVILDGGHYARIEIVPQPNGQIFGIQDSFHFIDIRVSYQPQANVPYAGRPQKRATPLKPRLVNKRSK